jgi:hypothetical protein
MLGPVEFLGHGLLDCLALRHCARIGTSARNFQP